MGMKGRIVKGAAPGRPPGQDFTGRFMWGMAHCFPDRGFPSMGSVTTLDNPPGGIIMGAHKKHERAKELDRRRHRQKKAEKLRIKEAKEQAAKDK